MTKILQSTIILLFAAFLITCGGGGGGGGGGSPAPPPIPGGSCADSSCSGFLVCQNFEGTGFDNSESWVTYAGSSGGVVNPGYTVSPLRGSQSLRVKDDTNEGTFAVIRVDPDAGYNTLYTFFRFAVITRPSLDSEIWQTYNLQAADTDHSDIEPHEILQITTSGHIKVWFPDFTSYTGSATLSLGTTYFIWTYMTRSTDKKSTGWVKVGTTKTMPAANDIEWTDHDISSITYRGTNTFGFTAYHGHGYEYKADQFLVKTSAIGDVCD